MSFEVDFTSHRDNQDYNWTGTPDHIWHTDEEITEILSQSYFLNIRIDDARQGQDTTIADGKTYTYNDSALTDWMYAEIISTNIILNSDFSLEYNRAEHRMQSGELVSGFALDNYPLKTHSISLPKRKADISLMQFIKEISAYSQ